MVIASDFLEEVVVKPPILKAVNREIPKRP